VLVADAYPNFFICGLPTSLSGDVADWRDLAHRTTTDLEQAPTTRSRLGCADWAAPSPDSHAPGAARPRLTAEIDELEAEITELVKHLARSLLAICGCGPLAAAKILGETAGVDRFRSKHVYARHTGTAPLPVGHPTERATVWSPDAKPQAMAAWKPCTSSNADYPMSSTAP